MTSQEQNGESPPRKAAIRVIRAGLPSKALVANFSEGQPSRFRVCYGQKEDDRGGKLAGVAYVGRMRDIRDDLARCTLCKDRFAATHTGHAPRPVVWFDPGARVLIAGQAPGMRVHRSGIPFDDPSGDRLRDWLGVEREIFYDRARFAVMPMGFCFPGYNAKGSDLPPPAVCAKTWRAQALEMLREVRVTVLIGGYAMKYHLPGFTTVTAAVQNWRDHERGVFALPHPSWRNTGWLKKNPWFERDVLPRLRAAVAEVLDD